MNVAHQLGKTLGEIYTTMDQDEVGWWLAFFKLKNKLEEEETERRRRNRGNK